MSRVLTCGFYSKRNVGDDLFQEAFGALFDGVDFQFVDHLRAADVASADAVVFGGGSLLDGAPAMDRDVLDVLARKPIAYVGVGGETGIHVEHATLMRRASFVALRGEVGSDRVRALCPNVMVTPDLVYALAGTSCGGTREGVLFLPNVLLVPGRDGAHWKHAAWDYFKSEMGQFLDELIDAGSSVTIGAMSQNDCLHDDFATVEIMNMMRHRSRSLLRAVPATATEAIGFFSQFKVVVTQRLHGAILADLARTPCVVVHHHDKLRRPGAVPYWGIHKAALQYAYRSATLTALPPSTSFDPLKAAFEELLRPCAT